MDDLFSDILYSNGKITVNEQGTFHTAEIESTETPFIKLNKLSSHHTMLKPVCSLWDLGRMCL